MLAAHPGVRRALGASLARPRRKLVRLMDFIVDRLDDYRTLEPALIEAGRTLASRGVGAVHLTSARQLMIEALRDLSGSRWTPMVERCWEEALAAVSGLLLRGSNLERARAA